MNLEGKTVKYHMFDKMDELKDADRSSNNHTNTCPALVLTDWNERTDVLTSKALNLQVFPDCGTPFQVTSACHILDAGSYPAAVEGDQVEIKKGHWEMY